MHPLWVHFFIMKKIVLNGKDYEVLGDITLEMLVESLGMPKEGTAVAVNSEVIPRKLHPLRQIEAGDRVEIIRAIGGG